MLRKGGGGGGAVRWGYRGKGQSKSILGDEIELLGLRIVLIYEAEQGPGVKTN